MNVTPVFFYRHLSSSALFSCTFLSFLALLHLSGIFSHSLLALDHRSPIVCLLHHSRACPLFCHHPCPCQSVHLLPSPASFFSFTFSYLSAYPSLCHFFSVSQVAKQMSGWIEPSRCCAVPDSISEVTDINSWASRLNDLGVWESTE